MVRESNLPHSPVQDNRLLHRVTQELLDIVPLQEGWRQQGVSRDLTTPVASGWPRGHGPQTAGRFMPTSFSGCTRWENGISPCYKLCTFLSDHLHFLKREHWVVGSWLSQPVTLLSPRQNPDLATLSTGAGVWREDRQAVLEFLNEREWKVDKRSVGCELHQPAVANSHKAELEAPG